MATARGSAAGAAQAGDAASRPLAVAHWTGEVAFTDAARRPGGHQGPSERPGRARDTRGRALCGRAAPVRANGHHTHVGGPGQRAGLRAEAGGRGAEPGTHVTAAGGRVCTRRGGRALEDQRKACSAPRALRVPGRLSSRTRPLDSRTHSVRTSGVGGRAQPPQTPRPHLQKSG